MPTSYRTTEEAYGRLKVMAVKRSMNTSLITSHEPNAGIFNTDGNGGVPHIVAMMLVQTRPGKLYLLPALPSAWPTGQVSGLRAVAISRSTSSGKTARSSATASPHPSPLQFKSM